MARTTHRLTALKAAAAKAKGLHHDGDGLYLRVTATGSKSWMLRYTLNGLTRDMGLGLTRKLASPARGNRQWLNATSSAGGSILSIHERPRLPPIACRRSASSRSASARRSCSNQTRAPGEIQSIDSNGATRLLLMPTRSSETWPLAPSIQLMF